MSESAPAPQPPNPLPPEPPRPPLSVRGWLAVAAAAAAVLALLAGGGYLLNRTLGDDETSVTGSAAPAADDNGDLGGGDFATGDDFDFGADTDTVAVAPTAVLPTCTPLPPAVDSAGRTHAYEAPNAIDGDVTTAWRCKGTQGQTLAISFPCSVHLATVGIDPGHDKTDPDGSDRFAQNRKVTRVKWTFDDGSSVEQQVEPRRGIQTMPVDTTARTATLTVLATVDGQPVTNRAGERSAPFNDVTSISEIRFTARAGDGGDGCVR
ncbi:NADase-type glycan-binding domain-containing protein [Rhodococcus sp. NPDC003348]